MKTERQARNNIVKQPDTFRDSNANFYVPLQKFTIFLRCGGEEGTERKTQDSGAATPCTVVVRSKVFDRRIG
jgi:hypothetical protein